MCELISKIITYPNGSNIFVSGVDPYVASWDVFAQNNIKVIVSILSNTLIPDMNKFGYQHYYYYLQDAPQADLLSILPCTFTNIHAAVERGENVLIHCRAGVSRSVSVLIGFFLKCLICTPKLVPFPKTHKTWTETCLRYIQKKRICANPNSGFLNQLTKLETYCECG